MRNMSTLEVLIVCLYCGNNNSDLATVAVVVVAVPRGI